MENVEVDPPRDAAARVWGRDSSYWGPGEDDPADRLGWLESPAEMSGAAERLEHFGHEMFGRGIRHVALLGMGGSSLAPEVFARTLGSAEGFPGLVVVDSTHPADVKSATDQIDLDRALFVVSSKSGGTIETMSLYRYFRSIVDDGSRFVAITDPGTSLEKLAREERFLETFVNRPDIGGRFSALSYFGLVPAALIGANLRSLLTGANAMARSCSPDTPPEDNPGVVLGTALGKLANEGRDKLTFLISEGLSAFGDWVEQLIAESTGKNGTGIAPIVAEPRVAPASYGHDRTFVRIRLEGDATDDTFAADLSAKGHPVITIDVGSAEDLGAEMFRWEFATAVASAALGVNAFDQPDVESAKRSAKEFLESGGDVAWPNEDPEVLFDGVEPGELAALLLFVPRVPEVIRALEAARLKLVRNFGCATSAGFGPRYLHSTGQLHKGGPKPVRALVVLDPPRDEVGIPGSPHGFARLVTAQAVGDADALTAAGRRVARTTLEHFNKWAYA
jgi:transaldolase / glucose-6-phosphate isomerase